jgi:hypothetical protein
MPSSVPFSGYEGYGRLYLGLHDPFYRFPIDRHPDIGKAFHLFWGPWKWLDLTDLLVNGEMIAPGHHIHTQAYFSLKLDRRISP